MLEFPEDEPYFCRHRHDELHLHGPFQHKCKMFTELLSLVLLLQASLVHTTLPTKSKEKTIPFGVILVRRHVSYWAAQPHSPAMCLLS